MTKIFMSGPVRLGVTGTYDLNWLRAQRERLGTLPLAEVERIIRTELAAHNLRTQQMIAAYATPVASRDGVDGTGSGLDGTMFEVDEYGRAPTQVTSAPDEAYFPLRRYQFAAGFTADFFRKRTGADAVAVLENAQAAHRKQLVKEIRDRLFSPVNYTFEDSLTDRKVLTIKGLYNADGKVPPVNGNLESFDGDHDHYMAFTAFTEANLRAAVNNAREHTDGAVEIHIAPVDEATLRTFPAFTPALDAGLVAGANLTTTAQTRGANPVNAFIGRFEGVSVYIRPWVFDGYAFIGDPNNPALGIRHPSDVEDHGLRMIGEIVTFPLQSQYWGAEFGIGVRARGAGVVAQFNAAEAGVYEDPTGRKWN